MDDHFPYYTRERRNMERIIGKIVRQLHRSDTRESFIANWYNDIHERHNASRWWGRTPPLHWKNLLSFQILDAHPTRIALKFFLHDVYCKEKLHHSPIHFHHIITLLAEHLTGLSPYIRPDDDIEMMFHT